MKKVILAGSLFFLFGATTLASDDAVDKRLASIEKRVEDLFQLLLKSRTREDDAAKNAERIRELEKRVRELESRETSEGEGEDAEKAALKEKLAVLMRELDSWHNRCDAMETQLERGMVENKNLEKKWGDLSRNYEILVNRYDQLASNLTTVAAEKEALQKEAAVMKERLEKEKADRNQVEEQNSSLREGLEALTERLKNLHKDFLQIKAVREKDGSWAPDLQKLLDAVFDIQPRMIWFPVRIPLIRGSVVGVSDKVNLVVINVGEEDGVRVGFEFTVYRENNYVGKLVVEKTFPRQAACRILLDKTKDKVIAGDQVATRWGD